MMNRRIYLLLAGIVLVFTAAYAQTKQKPKKSALVAYKKPVMDVAIGKSDLSGGTISKSDFDQLAPAGIRIKDANGAFIEGFSFTYGERNIYEDSVGNEKRITEYLTEYCMGDTLSPIIAHTINDRSKPGDTAYYDDIHIRLPNGKPALGKPMKFVITR
jgi:hypothetical protein